MTTSMGFKDLGTPALPVYPAHHYLGLGKRVSLVKATNVEGVVTDYYPTGLVVIKLDRGELGVYAPNELDPA